MINTSEPIFVKISENHETVNVLDDLLVRPVNINVGDELNIGGKTYIVNRIKDEKGNFAIKNSDLKKNIKTYEELLRTGIITDFFIDDLCLANKVNGDVLIEVSIPENPFAKEKINHITHSNQRSFFVRLDGSLQNPKLTDKKVQYRENEIKLTPCMFASDSALAITESGKRISITERNTSISERLMALYVMPHFTLYEREIVSRLVGTVNLLCINGKINKITTALPRGAYYSFLFQSAADGFATPDMVLDWFKKVDARVKFLRLLIKEGIHQYHPQIPIEQYSFMDSACDMMQAYFRVQSKMGAQKIDIEELFTLVLNTIIARDPFANQIFAEGVEKPTNFQELANFTYAVGNLTDMANTKGKEKIFKQIIGVYDVSETLMWTVAKKIRNKGLLETRGQFNQNVPQNSTYDHLSYISVMPIEHVIFDISPEFAEKYMGGFTRLYSVRKNSLTEDLQDDIINTAMGLV